MRLRPTWLATVIVLAACGQTPTDEAFVVSAAHHLPKVAVEVVDGDSLVGDDGTRYRLAGINAPDAPECLAEEATGRLAQLIADGAYFDATEAPVDQFGRKLVGVFMEDADEGNWVNQRLVAEGLALVIQVDGRDDLLLATQEQAQRDAVGLWDPESCGEGPVAAVEIIDLGADPPGPDEEALDDEFVEIANMGDEPVEMTGWVLRDESTRNRFVFPDGFVLGPGETVIVTSGDGEFGFGLGQPIWNNSGDTAFLVDDQGRFVAFRAVSD